KFAPALIKIVPLLMIVPFRKVAVLLSNWMVPAPEKCVPLVKLQLLASSTVAPADAENVPALVPPTRNRNVPFCADTVPELFKAMLKLSAPVPVVFKSVPELLKVAEPAKRSLLSKLRL